MTDTQPGPVPTHRMLAGRHERTGGPECRCGASWDKFNDRCAAQVPVTDTQPAPTVPDEAVEAMARAIEPWAFRYDEGAIEGCVARASARRQAREGLTAAAPFIVAANQPDAAEVERLRAQRDAVLALAETWRYKGEFGWGAWQEGHGPDQEGYILDGAAATLRRILEGDATP